ncbi:MAG: iron-containing alcohol dehydrogenase [Treponemataceae bacterium]|nr:iron-containing alcohol dehydrogenase [Treponemataceae bacterium]
MGDFSIKISPNILIGTQTTSRLGSLAAPFGNRFLLIIDPATDEVSAKQKIGESLKGMNLDYILYDDLPDHPDTTTLESILKIARGGRIQGVIACGGEKAMNIGRGVASLFNEDDRSVYDFADGDYSTKPALPFFGIPTSIRDTFAFYERCGIIDGRSNQFRLIKVQKDITKALIFDVAFCSSLTKNQIASLSLNVLTLALESYFSSRSNFFSDAVAEKIFELLAPSASLTDPLASQAAVDNDLLQCGCLASLAAQLSAPGPITALSFAAYSRYKLPRPIISAILLPYLIEDTVFAPERIKKAAKLLGAADENCTPETAASLLAEDIRGRIARAQLPARLKELSVSIEQLAVAVNDASQLDFVPFYAKPVSADVLFNLVKQAY